MHQKIKRRTGFAVALVQCWSIAWADTASREENLRENGGLQKTEYVVNMHGCPIQFSSRAGGKSGLDPSDTSQGGFRRNEFKYRFDLGIEFHCYQEPVAQRCPEALDLREDDPSTLRLMRVARYRKINPLYEGSAVAYTFTAVNPPRGRLLQFCLGNGERTLVGRSMVGDEKRAFTSEVLRIVATIRFIDEQQRR